MKADLKGQYIAVWRSQAYSRSEDPLELNLVHAGPFPRTCGRSHRILLKLQWERNSTKRKPPEIIPANHLEILTEVRDLLKPLEQATQMLSKEKTVTLTNVIPIIFGLTEVGRKSYDLNENTNQCIVSFFCTRNIIHFLTFRTLKSTCPGMGLCSAQPSADAPEGDRIEVHWDWVLAASCFSHTPRSSLWEIFVWKPSSCLPHHQSPE